MTRVLLPAKVVYQLDKQIADLEHLITRKQKRLAELREMRAAIEKEQPRKGED